jgi:hypothetical protein
VDRFPPSPCACEAPACILGWAPIPTRGASPADPFPARSINALKVQSTVDLKLIAIVEVFWTTGTLFGTKATAPSDELNDATKRPRTNDFVDLQQF